MATKLRMPESEPLEEKDAPTSEDSMVTVRNNYGGTVFLPNGKLKSGEECEMTLKEFGKYSAYLEIVS